MRRRHAHGPLAEQGVFQGHQRSAPEVGIEVVHGRDPGHPVIGPDLQVVLQVLADAGAVGAGLQTQALQPRAVADPAQLQQLGRVDGAGAQRHLGRRLGLERLTLPQPLDPRGPSVFKPDPRHVHAAQQSEVGPAQHRLEERRGRAPADPGALGHVEIGAAGIVAAVEVPDTGNSSLGGGLGEGVQHLPAHGRRFHPQLAAVAVRRAGGIDVILLRHEQGQDIVPAPALQPHLPPAVIVGGLAPHVDHGVDGRGAADHPPAGVGDAAPAEPRIGLGAEHPVRPGMADGEQVSHGDVQPDPVVLAPGLEQQHPAPRVCGQPVGQHAAGGSRADDDVVEAPEFGGGGAWRALSHVPA